MKLTAEAEPNGKVTDTPSNKFNSQAPSQHSSGRSSPLLGAAKLIREIDSALSVAGSYAVTAANEAEEARQNAKVASAVASLYKSSAPSFSTINGSSPRHRCSVGISPMAGTVSSPASKASSPRPPLPPHRYGNSCTTPGFFKTPQSPLRDHPSVETNYSYDSSANQGVRSPLSTERLAQSHAEDVLSISLELQRSRKGLEAEQVAHENTRLALETSESRHAVLQQQVDALLKDQETQRQSHGLEIDRLEQELQRTKQKQAAAEQDAQLALDLAKGNAESREQLEGWLKRALEEIDTLRNHMLTMNPSVTLPAKPSNGSRSKSEQPKRLSEKRSVRFADSSTVFDGAETKNEPVVEKSSTIEAAEASLAVTPSRPTRSIVAAGRSLLDHSTSKEHIITRIPSVVAADRRMRLRNRLATPLPTPRIPRNLTSFSSSTSTAPVVEKLGAAVDAIDATRNTALILKESALRLKLHGRYWNEAQMEQLDDLARHYCTSVEVR